MFLILAPERVKRKCVENLLPHAPPLLSKKKKSQMVASSMAPIELWT